MKFLFNFVVSFISIFMAALLFGAYGAITVYFMELFPEYDRVVLSVSVLTILSAFMAILMDS